MRNGHFNRDDLTNKLTQNDDFILDNSPIVDKWGDKYDKKYQIFTYVLLIMCMILGPIMSMILFQ